VANSQVGVSGRERPGGVPGTSSRELLVVLLAEFWFGCTAPIPSAALVAVMAEFGVTEANVRVALGRLVRQGVVEPSREGRRTFYRITDDTRELLAVRGRALMRFGLDWPQWDGRWTCVAFSLTGDGRSGSALRAEFRTMRMAQLYDGFWVSPHDLTMPVSALLARLGIGTATVMRSRIAGTGFDGRDPVEAWDLETLRERYVEFTAAARALDARRRRRELDATAALVERTGLTLRWRAFAWDDPLLPFELLPPDWPLLGARRAFVAAYDRIGPQAERRVRTVVAPAGPAGPWRPRHHKTIDLV
jgi:phenylacetic acid degradation operon negative regulatory protein